jgi:hypothetical protein
VAKWLLVICVAYGMRARQLWCGLRRRGLRMTGTCGMGLLVCAVQAVLCGTFIVCVANAQPAGQSCRVAAMPLAVAACSMGVLHT